MHPWVGAHLFVLTHQSVVEELRCSLESRKPIGDFESNSHQEGWRNAWSFLPWWGEAPSIPSLGNILAGDQITYLLVSFFCEPLHSCMCVYLNSARVTVMF